MLDDGLKFDERLTLMRFGGMYLMGDTATNSFSFTMNHQVNRYAPLTFHSSFPYQYIFPICIRICICICICICIRIRIRIRIRIPFRMLISVSKRMEYNSPI